MIEKHQEAITKALSGDFTALNHIERVIAQLHGLKPLIADEQLALKYAITGNILSPAGRCIGYVWATECGECKGSGWDGKLKDNCFQCDGTGMDEINSLATDCNGNLLPATGTTRHSDCTINDTPAVPA